MSSSYNEKALEILVKDQDFLRMVEKYKKTNYFEVIGNPSKETMHTNFLYHLFDPETNHGLNNYPLKQLLILYYKKQGKKDCDTIISEDIKNVKLSQERAFWGKENNGRVDIFGENAQMVLVLENKVTSGESITQTEKYYSHFSAFKKNKYFIYLSALGEKAQSEFFVNINYQDLYDEVIKKCIEHPDITEEWKRLLEHYAITLEKVNPGSMPMAMPNKDMCRRIYDNNTEAFSLIKTTLYDAKRDKSSSACIFYENYKKILNTILLASNQDPIVPNEGTKRKGIELIKFLCERGKIVPGEDSDEFLYHNKNFEDINFVVQVIKTNNSYGLISGYYKIGEEIGMRAELDGNDIFFSFTDAIDSAVKAYYESQGQHWLKQNGPGSSMLKNRKYGTSPREMEEEAELEIRHKERL